MEFDELGLRNPMLVLLLGQRCEGRGTLLFL
jgi:hypothetical protein